MDDALGRTTSVLTWSGDGRHVFLRLHWPRELLYESGKTYILRLPEAGGLPPSFSSEADVAAIPGIEILSHGGIFPGPHSSFYAYTRGATHRNIYRISLP